ncbi:protein DpdG [Bosea sp. BIWAKO-01]|uniref:protein DpdG n=1 Tax=Bosea sp. BIWAKO-01 TaxID=506668 RepID=UPI000852CD69|nr:protein DpdG [Bosea sp. BIWAKO-01]
MSIITVAPAVPNRILLLFASLLESESGEDKVRFEAAITPPPLRKRGKDEEDRRTSLFSSPMREARNLGLIEERGEKYFARAGIVSAGKKSAPLEDQFRQYLRQVLFDAARAKEADQSDFAPALTWLLMQNPLSPMPFGDAPQIRMKSQIGDLTEAMSVTNINTFQNLVYWARYLGFATLVGSTRGRFVVADPIEAILAVLPQIFADQNELRLHAFMAGLVAHYPVFEGGSFRQFVEEAALPGFGRDSDQRLSISTSLALVRLEHSGVIALTTKSDADVMILDLGGEAPRRISHISLVRAS